MSRVMFRLHVLDSIQSRGGRLVNMSQARLVQCRSSIIEKEARIGQTLFLSYVHKTFRVYGK